jgi:shikimate dehydrogenase
LSTPPAPVAAVIGSPVGHSLSPVIHRAAFAAAGLDWSYVAFDVAPGHAPGALEAMRTLGIAGFSVTTPHKQDVAAAVDELDPAARALRSVNTVVNRGGGRLVGYSTDGDGFVAALGAEAVDVAGMTVLVLGAGAAARSVVDALGRARVASIVVANRTAGRVGEIVQLTPVARPAIDLGVEVAAAELIVNATSVGFGREESPLEPALLHSSHLVADLVYHPLDTALLRAARAAGARTFDGLGMLIHQAALQQRLWTGHDPDVAAMRAAAVAELDRRSTPSA